MIDGLDTIGLVELVRNSGVELKQHGSKHTGLCPFHADNNPSLYLFDDNRFKCFGCGEYGDAIDFIRKLNGISFVDALKALGLHTGIPLSKETKSEIEKRKKQRELSNAFKEWQRRAVDEVATLLRYAHKLLGEIKDIETFEKYCELFDGLMFWEYHFDILTSKDDALKLELFKRKLYAN